jgi:hypothetical protein
MGDLRGINGFKCPSFNGIDEFVVDEQTRTDIVRTNLEMGEGGSYGCE